MRRLWLEVHRPELAVLSSRVETAMRAGRSVGEAARVIYAKRFGGGRRIPDDLDSGTSLDETRALLGGEPPEPVFEGAVRHEDVTIRADVLLPQAGRWRLVEVKAGTEVQEEHAFDCAVQAWVLDGAGLRLDGVRLAHVDSDFVYRGDGDYSGLLAEADLTVAAFKLDPEVSRSVVEAREVLGGAEPDVGVGKHCFRPHECPFISRCWPTDTDFPLLGLGGNKARLAELAAAGHRDVREVPPDDLTERQRLIRRVSRSGRAWLSKDAAREVAGIGYPRYYLDFETIAPAVPIWPGARPYEALPFQWSCHYEGRPGAVQHADFLDLSGEPPIRRAAASLVRVLGREGPVLTYTHYEREVIRALARHAPELAPALAAIIRRLVDLKLIVERHYYHPQMCGSWSLKAVLPTIAPDMRYTELEEIQDGTAASEGYLEAVDPATPGPRKAELAARLRRYCRFDTEGMVRLAHFLAGGA